MKLSWKDCPLAVNYDMIPLVYYSMYFDIDSVIKIKDWMAGQ